MAIHKITGSKGGGGGGHTPTEQPNDLISVAKAKVLVALGEGEFAGGLTGQNIYLGGTPILNADGTENFPGIKWEFRPGTQAQTYIQGMPGSENEVSLNSTEIKSGTPWTKSFTNTQLSAVRLRIKWPSIFKQKDNGDLVGNTINYAIDLQTDGGTWQTVLDTSVSGKTTSGYERSHRIDLPVAHTGWTVRLRKITADANSAKIGDVMTLQSYTEVIDAKFRYPNTALLYLEFDSTLFNGSIPQISCEPRGRVIRVPDTYDPETRSYSGTWEGNFKWAWSNNPAWVFYDIVTSDRFGLGERLTAENIDIWTLYQVAQYCDQEVPDGKGGNGTQPRYLCDVYVQNRNEAFTVLRDFAAIFRGMTYWGGDQLVAMADMPRDVDYIYTRANVIDGRFTYASSTAKSRYSTALVSWSDPANQYADAMRPVFETDLVARYGVNQLEITAIGCTREAEADRKGRWGILTNNKDRVITFSVGLDGNIPQPGYVIAVADELLSGRVMGGRISEVAGRVLTLDRAPDAKANDRLLVNLPSGITQGRTIESVAGNVVTVTAAFGETPQAECVWCVESDELYAQQYRVTSVTDNGDGTYSIAGAQHDPDKYARIDTGAIIDDRPISVIPAGNQKPPANVAIEAFSMVDQGINYQTMRATWDAVEGAIAYESQWRRDDNNWVNIPRSSTTSFDVPNIYAGRYQVRVRAINAVEVSSAWAYAKEANLTGKQGNPPAPLNFKADHINWGIMLSWNFGPDTSDTLKTEIQYGTSKTDGAMLLLADVPYPQASYAQLGLKAGQSFFYRAKLVDKTGNESPWTDWITGMANDQADDYLGDIVNDFLTKEDGKELISQIEIDPTAILQNALANHENVVQQWEQFGKNRAGILRAEKLISDAEQSIAEVQEIVYAAFDESNAESIVSQVKQAQASADKAQAFIDNELQAQLNEIGAAISQKMDTYVQADGSAAAIYTLKTGVQMPDGTQKQAGLSVAVTMDANGQPLARVAVQADQFVILSAPSIAPGQDPNAVIKSPFAVVNGQVFISDAFIQDGTITNAKIGQFIQSNNYQPGAVGWSINKDGGAEFSNVTIRGHVEASSGHMSNVVIDDTCTVQTLRAENIQGDLLIGSSYVEKQIGAANSPSINAGQLYPICYIPGAPFSRQVTFVGDVIFRQGQRNTIEIVNEAGGVVWSWDTGNIDTAEQRTRSYGINVDIGASSYGATQALYLRWSRGGAVQMNFNGVVLCFKKTNAISI
jgi:predicted phage tail protein